MTIFVQIPSYRDRDVVPTLCSLIDQAATPEALSVAVCWQHAPDETLHAFVDAGFRFVGTRQYGLTLHALERRGTWVMLIDIDAREAQGVGWARNIARSLYRNQRYALQIDSHHRFVPRWDAVLVETLESLRCRSRRPVLTAYAPHFQPDKPLPRTHGTDRMCVYGLGGNMLVVPCVEHLPACAMTPIPARLFSGHFSFADGRFLLDVPSSPDDVYGPDEIRTAAVAFTHGYDLYHPASHVLWHNYTASSYGRPLLHERQDRQAAWLRSREIAMIDLGMRGERRRTERGYAAWGSARTLRQFAWYSGIAFRPFGVSPEALARHTPTHRPPDDHQAWVERLLCPVSVKVRLPPFFSHKGYTLTLRDRSGNVIHSHPLDETDTETVNISFVARAAALPHRGHIGSTTQAARHVPLKLTVGGYFEDTSKSS